MCGRVRLRQADGFCAGSLLTEARSVSQCTATCMLGVSCVCHESVNAVTVSQMLASVSQDERQLHVSRQLASSRQAKPSVARRLLVDAHADGAYVSDVPSTHRPLPWRGKSDHVSGGW